MLGSIPARPPPPRSPGALESASHSAFLILSLKPPMAREAGLMRAPPPLSLDLGHGRGCRRQESRISLPVPFWLLEQFPPTALF